MREQAWKRSITMSQKRAAGQTVRYSFWEHEEPGIRVPYQAVRHAQSTSGPVRIHGLELTRAEDVVILRAVNLRDQVLRQFIEVPLHPEVLRQVAAVLQNFAAQAERETAALRWRLARGDDGGAGPDRVERGTRAGSGPVRREGSHWRSEAGGEQTGEVPSRGSRLERLEVRRVRRRREG
jgi:hypothetical protein